MSRALRPAVRATSPVVAVVLLVGVTLVAATAVGATLATAPAAPAPVTELRLHADAGQDRLAITHVSGDALNASELRLRVRVDGQPLVHQPPVPFFAARGFRSGPTGPFNPAGGTAWHAGQRATLGLASTNAPRIDPGDHVTVTVSTERTVLAELDATAT